MLTQTLKPQHLLGATELLDTADKAVSKMDKLNNNKTPGTRYFLHEVYILAESPAYR